jgi:hypothetical protein
MQLLPLVQILQSSKMVLHLQHLLQHPLSHRLLHPLSYRLQHQLHLQSQLHRLQAKQLLQCLPLARALAKEL